MNAISGWLAGELPSGEPLSRAHAPTASMLSVPADSRRVADNQTARLPSSLSAADSQTAHASLPLTGAETESARERLQPAAASQTVDADASAETPPARPSLSPKAAAELLDAGELFSRALEAAAQILTTPDAAADEPSVADPLAELEPQTEHGTEPPTEIEIPRDPADDQVVIHAALPSELALFPLFAELDSDALAELIPSIDSIEVPDGAYVLQRGELSDSLFGIVRGSVTVLGADHSYQLALTEGDVFGESCLLKNEPRHADVRAKGELCAVRIPRRALFQLLRRKPKLAEHLLELLTRRLLGSFLLSSTLFRELGAEARRALARLFEMRLFPAGTVFAACGKPMDHLCIALTGQLTVEKPGFVPIVAPAGYVFGQQTLFSNAAAPATVTARVNMVVLRLPAVALRQLAVQFPTIRVHLAGLSTSELTRVNL